MPGRSFNNFALFLLLVVGFCATSAWAHDDAPPSDYTVQSLLPPSLSENLEVNVWGWLGYLHDSESNDQDDYWEADLALGATQRIGDRLAVSADIHFIDDNNHTSGNLEQAFGTFLLSTSANTLVTVGKFNASFGAEARDEWGRLTGTTSLLFGAEPQDLIGVMLTQPLGKSGVTLRPFIVNGFEGHFHFDQPPSGGMTVEYRRNDSFSAAITNWIGPGVIVRPDYNPDAYDTEGYIVQDWRGPDLAADHAGVLYFVDAKVQWMPRPDLTLIAEGLLAETDRQQKFSWSGFMALANYDLTDRVRIFGRWSTLNDARWIVTGLTQRRHELSAGVGYQVIQGSEIRVEYRHDFGPADSDSDMDSLSAHLVFSY